jgi:hypothetical protein
VVRIFKWSYRYRNHQTSLRNAGIDDELREICFWRCWCFDLHGRNREQELKDEAFSIKSSLKFLFCWNKIDNSNQEQLEQQVAFGQRKCLMLKYIQYQLCKILMFLFFQRIITLCQNRQRITQRSTDR